MLIEIIPQLYPWQSLELSYWVALFLGLRIPRFLFFGLCSALPPHVTQTKEQKKTGEAWERGYHMCKYTAYDRRLE